MSQRTFFYSDPHLGHENILTFKDNDGNLLRPFKSIEEHDETLIEKYNQLVKPTDRVYWMGDCAMHRRNLHLIGRFNGNKKLIKGNHDIFKLKDYTPYFEDILSYRVYASEGFIVSHIPVHPQQLQSRFKFNVHGHTHSNFIESSPHHKDPRYINLCVEHTDWSPVCKENLLERMKANAIICLNHSE